MAVIPADTTGGFARIAVVAALIAIAAGLFIGPNFLSNYGLYLLSYWAVTVGTSLVHYVPVLGGKLSDILIGGEQIGQNTLQRFYALHVAVLPVLLALGLFGRFAAAGLFIAINQ